LSTTKRTSQDSAQKDATVVKATTASRFGENVSQQDGPLPYKHNAERLYLGKDFSEQQTANG
jgi:hypothetical protein